MSKVCWLLQWLYARVLVVGTIYHELIVFVNGKPVKILIWLILMMTTAQFRRTIRGLLSKARPKDAVAGNRDPYRILVSEIMLQQTQVSRVAGFYENFIKKFPNFRALAEAKTVDVLQACRGLAITAGRSRCSGLQKKLSENTAAGCRVIGRA